MDNKKEDFFIKILTSEYLRLNSIIDFSQYETVELDLGCGKGSFTTALAARYPERLVLAADIMIGRLRKLDKRNRREGIENLIPLRVEARSLLGGMMPDETLDRLHILCPDPWPKGRHRSNRLLCSDFMTHIQRTLKPGGVFHFSTDDDQYYDIVTQVVEASGRFTRNDAALADIADIKTDFEERWLEEGKHVRHVAWTRKKMVMGHTAH